MFSSILYLESWEGVDSEEEEREGVNDGEE